MTSSVPVTLELAQRVTRLRFEDLPKGVVTSARQCLLDWVGVAAAGRNEALVGILLAAASEEGGHAQATVIGSKSRLPVSQAALVNGAMGHALDFDDVNEMGHPSAPVAPVVLALGELLGSTGPQILEAFVAGYETETRLGRFMGPSHYARGWHTTSTFGTFGATAAAAKLLGLDDEALCEAFGIAGTQAAGLKAVFGTMCKPLHAGHAARTGIEAVRLAKRGFTSNRQILEAKQGFGYTQSSDPDPQAVLMDPEHGFFILDNLYKYHAACYLTHSAIEAMLRIRMKAQFSPDDVEHVTLAVSPLHMDTCNISAPRTGLECKFSLAMMAALTICGEDTANEAIYSDVTATRSDLAMVRQKVCVEPTSTGTLARVAVRLNDGRVLEEIHDVARPCRDLVQQQAKLEAKFRRLLPTGFQTEALLSEIGNLSAAPSIGPLMALLA